MRVTNSLRLLLPSVVLLLSGACESESLGPRRAGPGSMSVVPSTATIGSGQSVQLTASLVDEFGEPLEGVVMSWSSSNPSVATVSVSGTVVGRQTGRAAIIATAQGKAQSAAIHVVADESGGKPEPAR
jgi:trimeric autotransporter adhesin